MQVQAQVLKFKYKYKYKYSSRNSQVQIAHLITDQFVTVYNQVNFINQTSNEIACFAISSLFVGRHCTNKCDNEQLSTVVNYLSWQQVLRRKYKYKYLKTVLKYSSSTSTSTKYNKSANRKS